MANAKIPKIQMRHFWVIFKQCALLPAAVAVLQPLHQSKWTKNSSLALLRLSDAIIFVCICCCIRGILGHFLFMHRISKLVLALASINPTFQCNKQSTVAALLRPLWRLLHHRLKAAWGTIEMEITRCSVFPRPPWRHAHSNCKCRGEEFAEGIHIAVSDK